MGCAASSDIDRAQSKHDLNSTSGIVTPCWWNAGANAILHADASDEKPTPAEEAQLAKLAEQWSIHSRGDIAEEPSRLLLAVREKKMIVMARLQNGIDDDPDQFVPFPEPERDVQASIARSRAWCDDVLAAMKRCEDSFVRSSSDHPLSNKASESFLLPGQTVCSQHEHATGVTLPMPTIFTTPALRSGDVAVSASNKADKAAPSSPGSKYLGGSGHDPYLALAMSSLSDAPTSTKGLHFGAGRGDSTPASGLNYARLLAKTGAGEATPIDRGVNCCPTPDHSPASSSYTLMQRSLTQENLVEHMMLIRAAHRRVTGTPRSYIGVDPAGDSSRNLTKMGHPPSPQLGSFPRW